MPDAEMAEKVYNVLFVCTWNSARSIIAEAILNRIAKGRFRAYSASSQPLGEINPHALTLLQRLDYPTEHLRSKDWHEFAAADAPPWISSLPSAIKPPTSRARYGLGNRSRPTGASKIRQAGTPRIRNGRKPFSTCIAC